ncbi:unnamed protein product, partial [Allacma fusca]
SKICLHIAVFAAFDLSIRLVLSSQFSFCSEGKFYSFSAEACPGGILLKTPLNIDEPCHCFGTDLRIYSTCGADSLIKTQSTPSGCEKPLIENKEDWDGQVMLLIPADLPWSGRSKQKETCAEISARCKWSNSTVVSEKPEKVRRKLPQLVATEEPSPTPNTTSLSDETGGNSSSESEEGSYSDEIESTTGDYTHTTQPLETPSESDSLGRSVIEKLSKVENQYDPPSSKIISSQVPQSISPDNSEMARFTRESMDKAMTENKQLMRHVWNVKSGHIPDPPPNTKTFKMIKKAMRIVSKIVPNKIIQDINFYEAYLAFRELFSHIDEDELTDKYLQVQGYRSVMLALDLCLNNARELPFKTTGRPRQIQSFYLLHDAGYTIKEPKLPENRVHDIDGEDYIVGIIWKIFDIALSACIQEFNENPGSQFDYVNAILNVFYRESVQNRWYQPQIDTTASRAMVEIISHPDIKILMQNVDKIDAAVHMASTFQAFLSKPKNVLIHDLTLTTVNPPVVSVGETTPEGVEDTTTRSSPPGNEPNNHTSSGDSGKTRDKRENIVISLADQNELSSLPKSRRKRAEYTKDNSDDKTKQNIGEETSLSAYEIWDGAAYCLQKKDDNLPPSYSNTFPDAKTACQNIQTDE